MPAVNRRSRASPAKQEAVQQCIALLSTGDNKLVKVRSIGSARPSGDSEVQVCEMMVPGSPWHQLDGVDAAA